MPTRLKKMKSFFEEYGFVILAAIIVILLIVMATPIGDLIRIQIDNTINSFGSKTQSKLNATDGVINVRVSTANNKITLEWDANKKEDVFKYSYKASNKKGEAKWIDKTNVDTTDSKSRTVVIDKDSNDEPLANKTKVEYKIYDSNDQLVASGVVIAKISKNIGDGSGGTVEEGISKTDSFVGYYADVDGNGTVDGIIFADLAVGGSYSAIPADELKSYKVSQEGYNGKFSTKPVLSPSGSGKDRFYVMALENFDSNMYTWYANAYNNGNGLMTDYVSTTSPDFGKGKANTATMISKWNAQAYGKQNARSGYKDLWGVIENKANQGWFVPSSGEWDTFVGELGITKDNFSNLDLDFLLWSSTQGDSKSILAIWYSRIGIAIGLDNANSYHYIRLATTF